MLPPAAVAYALRMINRERIVQAFLDLVAIDSPTGAEDASMTMNLVDGLRGRGLSDGDISKILGENTLRVMRDVEAAAKPDA